ncbi:MAG: hypothetical protein P1U56_05390 [Saprospiraceae bacterium]|nr:hypothetical protein [Saprospiraceae bacterium]
MRVDQPFFDDKISLHIGPTENKAKIEYRLEGNEKWQSYKIPISIDNSTKIFARASSKSFIDSEVKSLQLVKLPKFKMSSVETKRKAHPKYASQGVSELIDRQKGQVDYTEGWLGYSGGEVVFDVDFDPRMVEKVIVSTLRNQDAWIFSPSRVQVFHGKTMVGEKSISNAGQATENGNEFIEIPLQKLKSGRLSIRVELLQEIPSWHIASGQKPWVFIDELLIY